METFSVVQPCAVCGRTPCSSSHVPIPRAARAPKLADFHTPEFRALHRYERLAALAEQHGSRLIAQEARNRAAALRDYITDKIG